MTNLYASMGRWDDALALERQAIVDSPEASVLRANLLSYEFGKGDLAAVLRDTKSLEDELRSVPDSALFFPAVAAALVGDDASAREHRADEAASPPAPAPKVAGGETRIGARAGDRK